MNEYKITHSKRNYLSRFVFFALYISLPLMSSIDQNSWVFLFNNLNTFTTMGPTGGAHPILRNYLINKHFLFFSF